MLFKVWVDSQINCYKRADCLLQMVSLITFLLDRERKTLLNKLFLIKLNVLDNNGIAWYKHLWKRWINKSCCWLPCLGHQDCVKFLLVSILIPWFHPMSTINLLQSSSWAANIKCFSERIKGRGGHISI